MTPPATPSILLDSLIPSIQPKWKRSVVTSTSLFEETSAAVDCQVCQEQKSRYCCPKCSIAYCSLDCYKNHGDTCIESFYEAKVTDALALERKATDGGDRGAIQEILNRVHQERLDDDEYHAEMESTEELERVMEAIEKGDDIVDLSPALQAAFERDVQAGRLNDAVVQPWCPWWESSVVVEELNDAAASDIGPSLDVRLLKIPPFSQLQSRQAPACLPFNLVSIVNSICLTLRLYGGVNNANANGLCGEATGKIIYNCPVLSKDARYDSLQQVLMENQEAKYHHDDVISLLANPRHVSHALLDGVAVFKAAEKENMKDSRQKLRRMRKKLEFYMSWSRGLDLKVLSKEIQTWKGEWKLTDEIESLRLS